MHQGKKCATIISKRDWIKMKKKQMLAYVVLDSILKRKLNVWSSSAGVMDSQQDNINGKWEKRKTDAAIVSSSVAKTTVSK